MKKTLPAMMIAFLSILMIFSACTEPEEFENVLIGSWKYTNYQTGEWEKIVFKGTLDFNLYHYFPESGSTTGIMGTYTYTDTTYTLKTGTSNPNYIVFKYAVSGDYLVIYPGKTYIRQ